jgi:hypothetical protein
MATGEDWQLGHYLPLAFLHAARIATTEEFLQIEHRADLVEGLLRRQVDEHLHRLSAEA